MKKITEPATPMEAAMWVVVSNTLLLITISIAGMIVVQNKIDNALVFEEGTPVHNLYVDAKADMTARVRQEIRDAARVEIRHAIKHYGFVQSLPKLLSSPRQEPQSAKDGKETLSFSVSSAAQAEVGCHE